MKVLFIGEGKHDIGRPEFAPRPQPARGVVYTLARRICPDIADESIALKWPDIPVLNREKKRKGYAAKVASVLVLAGIHDCEGIVCVADQDREVGRLRLLEEGKERGLNAIARPRAVVCAVAVESIDAWTLGDPAALANVLGLDLKEIHGLYKIGDVESFYEGSGKPEHRPKAILARVATLAHVEDTTDFRERVAECADINALERACPQGFAPFARELRTAFG